MLWVLGSLYNFANRHWRAVALLANFGWSLAGAALTAWATWATSLFAPYAPFSWVCAGLIGALIFAGVAALYGYVRVKLAQAQAIEYARRPPTTVNPLRNNFEREKINLSDFWAAYVQARLYKSVVFRSCDIYGPGSIVIGPNSQVINNRFILCDLILVKNEPVNTGIVFESSVFDYCKFINVSLYLAEDSVRALMDSVAPGAEKPIVIGYGQRSA
jgi:hypothetical protein